MKRTLSLSAIISIIFFGVCGGPYAVEGVLAAGPGLALLLMVLTPLLWSTPIALVCAELGSALPNEGGYYAWSTRTLGQGGAFCHGMWAWLFTVVDIGIYPAMFCDYLAYFIPAVGGEGSFVLRKTIMLAIVWTFVVLNLLGTKVIANFTRAFVLLVLTPFVLLVGISVWRAMFGDVPRNPASPFLAPGLSLPAALGATIPLAMWNFQGWDSSSTLAGEMEHPRRDYPRGLFFTVILVVLTYSLPAIAVLLHVPFVAEEWDVGAWSMLAARVGGSELGMLVSAAGMVSALGLFSMLLFTYSRVPFAMSCDGYFPRAFGRTNRAGVPAVSLLFSGVAYSAVILCISDFDTLAEASVTFYAGTILLEMLSFLVLRYREPHLPRPFRVPGGWFVACLVSALPLTLAAIGATCRSLEQGVWNVVGLAVVLMLCSAATYPLARLFRREVVLIDHGYEPEARAPGASLIDQKT